MKSRWIISGVIIIVLILGGAFLFINSNKTTNAPETTSSITQSPTTTTEEANNSEKTVEVTLTTEGYSPASITIDKGTKVIWTNNTTQEATVNSDPHPFHTNYPPLNLGNFNNGEKLELIFDKTGTYGYHNHFNSSQRGTVVVK